MIKGIREKRPFKKAVSAKKPARLLSVDAEDAGEKPTPRKAYARRRLPALIPLVLIPLIFCFAMISPLSGCVLDDRDYIGTAAAASIALEDSGVYPENARHMQSDMILLDGEAYYKVQFTGPVMEYRYIVDAGSGDIIMQTFAFLNKDA